MVACAHESCVAVGCLTGSYSAAAGSVYCTACEAGAYVCVCACVCKMCIFVCVSVSIARRVSRCVAEPLLSDSIVPHAVRSYVCECVSVCVWCVVGVFLCVFVHTNIHAYTHCSELWLTTHVIRTR